MDDPPTTRARDDDERIATAPDKVKHISISYEKARRNKVNAKTQNRNNSHDHVEFVFLFCHVRIDRDRI